MWTRKSMTRGGDMMEEASTSRINGGNIGRTPIK